MKNLENKNIESFKANSITMKPLPEVLTFILDFMYSLYKYNAETNNKDKTLPIIEILSFQDWLIENGVAESGFKGQIVTLDEAIRQQKDFNKHNGI